MTPLLFVAAAAVGAGVRLVAGLIERTWMALLVVNVAGSFVLGWVVHADVAPATVTVVGVGFCGALTTYSSFALEMRRLGPTRGAAYGAATVSLGVAAAVLGSLAA